MTDKLLPCPFCGADAATYIAFPKFEHPWAVTCDHADDCILVQATGMMPCEATNEAMTASWNRRAGGIPPVVDAEPSLRKDLASTPAGYVLVPIKPTKEMAHEAACHFYGKNAVAQAGGIDGIVMQARNGDPSFWIAFKKFWRAALAHSPQPSGPATASKTSPIEYRNEEAGFVEFVNDDRPYIVRDIPAPAAVLVDMETRQVIGYRVYDPAMVGGLYEAALDTIADLRAELAERKGIPPVAGGTVS